MRKEVLDEKEYRAAVRAIIKRDFFPELQKDEQDDTISQFQTLNSFCARCVSKEDNEFIKAIENERQKLQRLYPGPKPDIYGSNPWKNSGRSALFHEPPKIDIPPVRNIKSISYQQTRFNNKEEETKTNLSIRNLLSDSATSESESEFDGKLHINRELFTTHCLRVVNRERLEKRKRTNQLSAKGKELLKSLRN